MTWQVQRLASTCANGSNEGQHSPPQHPPTCAGHPRRPPLLSRWFGWPAAQRQAPPAAPGSGWCEPGGGRGRAAGGWPLLLRRRRRRPAAHPLGRPQTAENKGHEEGDFEPSCSRGSRTRPPDACPSQGHCCLQPAATQSECTPAPHLQRRQGAQLPCQRIRQQRAAVRGGGWLVHRAGQCQRVKQRDGRPQQAAGSQQRTLPLRARRCYRRRCIAAGALHSSRAALCGPRLACRRSCCKSRGGCRRSHRRCTGSHRPLPQLLLQRRCHQAGNLWGCRSRCHWWGRRQACCLLRSCSPRRQLHAGRAGAGSRVSRGLHPWGSRRAIRRLLLADRCDAGPLEHGPARTCRTRPPALAPPGPAPPGGAAVLPALRKAAVCAGRHTEGHGWVPWS